VVTWDPRMETAQMVRDRMGVKPSCCHPTAHALVSEPKAIMPIPPIPPILPILPILPIPPIPSIEAIPPFRRWLRSMGCGSC
jgi:asparagine synthetase B (glutamine-hydrolysing)